MSLRVVTRMVLTCDACGKSLENDWAHSPHVIAPGAELAIGADIVRAFIKLKRASSGSPSAYGPQGNWSQIEDEQGFYDVCPSCHRRPRKTKDVVA